jgi:hypothetical protein
MEQRGLVAGIPDERLEELGDALLCGFQREHPLLEVLAVVAGVAVRHRDRLRIQVAFGRRVVPADRKRGRVGVQPGHRHPKRPACPQRQPSKQHRHIVRVQPIQRPSQAVVVEVGGADCRT